jgi:hypothetical protein
LEKVAPLGEVGGLEVEGDRDEGFDALDGGGLSPKSGMGSLNCGHGGGEVGRRRTEGTLGWQR